MANAEEYLGRIELMDMQINDRWEDLQRLYAMRTKMTTIFTLVPAAMSGNKSKVEDLSIKILELEGELNRKIDEFINFKLEALGLIEKLNDKRHLKVLNKIYFKYMPVDDVAYDLDCSSKTVRNLQREALQTLDAILAERE